MEKIPLSSPVLAGNEWQYVKECLDTNWVSYAGRFVKLFEEQFAAAVGSRHGIASSSGTSALHLAALAGGIQARDLVLVPALTFIATANPVRYCGGDPVFLDVERSTWDLDPVRVREFLESECERRDEGTVHKASGRPVRAMIPVHLYGHPARMPALEAIAREFGLVLLEDATESLGAKWEGRGVGTWGRISCFSFNGNKLMTTGGGGMCVTDDDALAKRIKHLSTQARTDAKRYDHSEVGYNYRMGNMQAAMGVAQLELVAGFLERKRQAASRYQQLLAGVPGISVYTDPAGAHGTYWLNAILTESAAARDRMLEGLEADGIEARAFFIPIHRLPPYRDSMAGPTPVSDELYARGVNLPSSSNITDAQIDRVAATVARIAAQS